MDFEFSAPAGSNPTPICAVAWELSSGAKLRLWQDEVSLLATAPYACDSDCLCIAYYASAEVGCHLALGWPPPANILDLFAEFRCMTNGLSVPCGSGLLGALAYYGLNSIGAVEKDTMRDLAMRGGPWTAEEKQALLDYCESDVAALARLLPAMAPRIAHAPRPLAWTVYGSGCPYRAGGRAHRRANPLAAPRIVAGHSNRRRLIASTPTMVSTRAACSRPNASGAGSMPQASRGHACPPGPLVLPTTRFAKWLARSRVLHRCGSDVPPSQNCALNDLAVGPDGRNRTLLSAFRASSGRNAPSSARYIFGPSTWLRALIKPPPGFGVAYVDWEQQEFGIAAALSGDALMREAYESADPYLRFAQQAGAVPESATKVTHPTEREQFKACTLAVQYRMEAQSLAQRIGQPVSHARELLRLHKRDVPSLLGVVRWRCGPCPSSRSAVVRLRLAGACFCECESAFSAQFSDAGKWRQDAADRLRFRD